MMNTKLYHKKKKKVYPASDGFVDSLAVGDLVAIGADSDGAMVRLFMKGGLLTNIIGISEGEGCTMFSNCSDVFLAYTAKGTGAHVCLKLREIRTDLKESKRLNFIKDLTFRVMDTDYLCRHTVSIRPYFEKEYGWDVPANRRRAKD
jgi:hypothetical protein